MAIEWQGFGTRAPTLAGSPLRVDLVAGRLGKQGEGLDVAWPHNREVSTVECRDRLLVESFGCGDDRSIDRSQWQIAVLVHKLGDSEPVGCGDGFDSDIATREVAEEPDLSVGTKSRRDQVDNLGDNESRNNERLGVVE